MSDVGMRNTALTIATLTSFMTPFMSSSINIALPAIEADFKMDALALAWVATSYLLAAAVSLVPFGRLADIHGRKKIFAYGILIFTGASFLCSVAFSSTALIGFRIIQGIGSAMIFATGIAILTSVFPPQERGKVLGINVGAVYVGLSVGPFLGGFLTQHFSWRGIFLVNVPMGIIIIALVLWKLKGEWAEAKGEKFDVTGSIIYAVGIVGILYGISLLPGSKGIWLIAAGAIALAAFVKWEMKQPSPVFQVRFLTTNRVFTYSSLAALINYSATFAVTFLLSLYLQHIKGLSPQSAGLLLVAQPIVMAAFSPLAGRLSDRIEPRIVASIGMALTTIALILFTTLNQSASLKFIIACLALLGFGLALFSSPNMNAVMGSVEKKFYGIASGTVGTMRLLGMVISMGIATLVFALFIGRVQISMESPPAFLQSLEAAFFIFSALCFGGIFASLVRGRLHPSHVENAAELKERSG
ncbi:MAG: MFS transporter [Deltaproteobacteria bacterium]